MKSQIAIGARNAAGRPAGGGVATEVYEDIRGSITRLELKPDTPLSRVDLAAQHGVSQSPVRDALQRLEQEGLVRIFPQSRTVVSRIDLPRLYEAHFLRLSVECEIALRLAQARPAATLSRASGILRMQEALANDLDQLDMFNDLDEQFHQTLFEGVGQGNLAHFLRTRAGQLARARRLDLPREDKLRDIIEAHREILAGIEAGDPPRAVAAIRAHLTGTVARIDELRAANPEYFSD